MKKFFGYTRVSTVRQGEHGVSLQEQHDAIARYAQRNGLEVSAWFEEKETAAKRGRPIFNRMLKLLKRGQVQGVIIHKIDRSARNLKDWADLGELIDSGVEVHFANEALDLNTRGGRLSADIQAVVAADYIRNLREETRKGIYGRIKQGLYPLPAPLGYLNKGAGKPKEPDPVRAPLVRRAFELYASGRYDLTSLSQEMFRLGLRNNRGNEVTRNGLWIVLNNAFYIGLIRLRRTGELFPGVHQPLVPKPLFDRVHDILRGKTNTKAQKHEFLLRRLLKCASCRYSLVGELQKGIVYYRCHSPTCRVTCVREDRVNEEIARLLAPLQFSETEQTYITQTAEQLKQEWLQQKETEITAMALLISQAKDRLARLTDAYLDGTIEKILFEERKASLLMERRDLEDRLAALSDGRSSPVDQVVECLELAKSAYLLYDTGIVDQKRELLKTVTSNRTVGGKTLDIRLSLPFREIAHRLGDSNGRPQRNRLRTMRRMIARLLDYFKSKLAVADDADCHSEDLWDINSPTRFLQDGQSCQSGKSLQ